MKVKMSVTVYEDRFGNKHDTAEQALWCDYNNAIASPVMQEVSYLDFRDFLRDNKSLVISILQHDC